MYKLRSRSQPEATQSFLIDTNIRRGPKIGNETLTVKCHRLG